MTDQTTQPAGWPARSAGRFFTIWIGQQFSLVGSTLAQFALVWWLTQTTGSATILATATAVAILPNVFLGPFVGVWVDRWSRRAILIAADGLVALASAVLALLFWSGAIQVWQVYLVLLVRAVGDTFHWPAMTATTPLMVPEQHLPRWRLSRSASCSCRSRCAPRRPAARDASFGPISAPGWPMCGVGQS